MKITSVPIRAYEHSLVQHTRAQHLHDGRGAMISSVLVRLYHIILSLFNKPSTSYKAGAIDKVYENISDRREEMQRKVETPRVSAMLPMRLPLPVPNHPSHESLHPDNVDM